MIDITEKHLSRFLFIGGIFVTCLGLMCCCFIGGATADDNISIPYRYTEQYQIDLDTYYQQFKAEQIFDETELYDVLYQTLIDTSLSWEQKSEHNIAIMGWDFRLEQYMNYPNSYTVDENTGIITWDLGIGNWWAKLVGLGIEESELPQNIAEGDALFKVYSDNFKIYVDALHAAGDP